MALMPAGKLCGAAVVNRADEALGAITDMMIDTETGGIVYAVLAHGGVLGIGERLFAVPWRAFVPDPVKGRLVLDVATAALYAAPGFDKDAWPTAASDDWLG